MARRTAVVAVVAVFALTVAGCSSLAPAQDRPAATETVTPMAVPTDTASAVGFPPGLAANGTVSTDELAAAHCSALGRPRCGETGNRSFTWRVSIERRPLGGGTVEEFQRVLRVGQNGAYRLRTRPSPHQSRTVYADATGTYLRTVVGNGSTERYLPRGVDYTYYETTTEYLGLYLSTDGASVARVERRGRTFFRVHVTDAPAAVRGGPDGSVSNYTATAYVTPAGFVRTLVVDYEYRDGATRVGVALRVGYEAVGETTVDQPDWAATLERVRTGEATASGPVTTETGSPPSPTPNAADPGGAAALAPRERHAGGSVRRAGGSR